MLLASILGDANHMTCIRYPKGVGSLAGAPLYLPVSFHKFLSATSFHQIIPRKATFKGKHTMPLLNLELIILKNR